MIILQGFLCESKYRLNLNISNETLFDIREVFIERGHFIYCRKMILKIKNRMLAQIWKCRQHLFMHRFLFDVNLVDEIELVFSLKLSMCLTLPIEDADRVNISAMLSNLMRGGSVKDQGKVID